MGEDFIIAQSRNLEELKTNPRVKASGCNRIRTSIEYRPRLCVLHRDALSFFPRGGSLSLRDVMRNLRGSQTPLDTAFVTEYYAVVIAKGSNKGKLMNEDEDYTCSELESSGLENTSTIIYESSRLAKAPLFSGRFLPETP